MKTCELCRHDMEFDRCGVGSIGPTEFLCHADDHDCYTAWTRDGERPPGIEPPLCSVCDRAIRDHSLMDHFNCLSLRVNLAGLAP